MTPHMIASEYARKWRYGPGIGPAPGARPGLGVPAAFLVLVFLTAPAALAQTYTVTINPTLNDLDVRIDHVARTDMLVVRLTNATEQRIRCRLNFDAAPQTPRRSSVNLRPGRTEQSVFRATRKWFSVNVDVVCELATGT
jgi:hypothetical protein